MIIGCHVICLLLVYVCGSRAFSVASPTLWNSLLLKLLTLHR